jgi:hypothetical protein
VKRIFSFCAELRCADCRAGRQALHTSIIAHTLPLQLLHGPHTLPLLLHCCVLRAVLPDKSYTAHVLGFTAADLHV